MNLPETDMDLDNVIQQVSAEELPKLVLAVLEAVYSIDLETEERMLLQAGVVARIAILRMGIRRSDPSFNELCMQSTGSAGDVLVGAIEAAETPEECADLIAKNIDKVCPEAQAQA